MRACCKSEGKKKSQEMQRGGDGVFEHYCVLRNSRWQKQLPGLAHPEARVAEETTRNDCQWVQPSRIMEKGAAFDDGITPKKVLANLRVSTPSKSWLLEHFGKGSRVQ